MKAIPSASYRIYGMPFSYFTRKLEAAFQLMGVPFQSVAKSITLREEVEARAGTHYIPVLGTPEGWMIHDTTPLLDLLGQRFPRRALFPEGPVGVLVHLLEEWFDEWFPRVVLHYRWQAPEDPLVQGRALAGSIAGDAPDEVVEQVAQWITGWGVRACRATGVQPPAQRLAAEGEFNRVFDGLEVQLGETRYALGDRPCAVDAVLLGCLRAHVLTERVLDGSMARLPRVVAWARDESPWDGEGELAPFPSTTGFGELILGEAAAAWASFTLGNAAAVAAGDKAFTVPVHGEAVSFKSRREAEHSRTLLGQRQGRLASEADRAAVWSWLEGVGLAEVVRAGSTLS